ncbi:MAG: hypothetical protein LBS29_00315 [Endomicrobium sp.]|nr:hypothetical protein [Endomicrobium sp.]
MKLLREFAYPDEQSYRVVFGESDGLPGVILDKYEDYICGHFVFSGADKYKDDILEATKNIFKPKGIFLKNDTYFRKLKNLNLQNIMYYGNIPENIVIWGNKINFYVDLKPDLSIRVSLFLLFYECFSIFFVKKGSQESGEKLDIDNLVSQLQKIDYVKVKFVTI